MAGERPAHPPQDPQTPCSIDLSARLCSAEKNSPRGPQRGHSLVAAPHRRPTAPAHPPERLPTTQQLVKESCTVTRLSKKQAEPPPGQLCIVNQGVRRSDCILLWTPIPGSACAF